jgi:hypothetical protein
MLPSIKHALRKLRKAPVFTAVAICSPARRAAHVDPQKSAAGRVITAATSLATT